MRNSIKLYWRYVCISIHGQMQYRTTFLTNALAGFVDSGVELFGLWVLFDRFRLIKGWSLAEVAMLYGLVRLGAAIPECIARGFLIFPRMVRNGEFDRFLLRPRSTALQVAAWEFLLAKFGRIANALIVLVWATIALGVVWTPARVGLTLLALLGSSCLFYGMLVLRASCSFWTIQNARLVGTISWAAIETGQYPLSIYHQWLRRFFTYIMPLAAVSYFPTVAILGRQDVSLGSPLWFQCAAPLIGIMFLVLAMQVWRIGVHHYQSTGS